MKSCWMDYWTGSDKNLTNEGGSRSGYGTWKRYQNRDHRAPIGLNRFSGEYRWERLERIVPPACLRMFRIAD